VIYHQCFIESRIAAGKRPPPLIRNKKRCTCRQEVTPEEAKELIQDGEAVWIVIHRERKPFQITCTLCRGDKEVKNCAECRGKGVLERYYTIDSYGDDIVAISIALRTPRTPTVESEHIFRAYVDGYLPSQKRIEEYGRLNAEFTRSLIVGEEPPDDPKTGTGRKYDFGRPIT